MLLSLYRYRRLIWQHALADLRHRYAGTGLGVVWNVLHPLALIAVYSIVFSGLMGARLASAEGPLARMPDQFRYVLYLCAGLLPWLAFAECITRGAAAFTDNAIYLRKLPIPEQVFVAQAAASATLGLGISFMLLVAVSLGMGLRPTAWWLLLPVPLAALQAMGFGLGLMCGTLNVFFRDVAQLLTVALQVILWTAPIVYLESSLPPLVRSIIAWHPLLPALRAVRDLFLYARPPSAFDAAAMFAWPALAMLLGGWVFRKLRTEIRDVL